MPVEKKDLAVLIAEMRGELGERLGRIEERQAANTVAAATYQRTVDVALEKFATKHELEAVEDKVKKVENVQMWALRGMAGSVAAALFAGLGISLRFKGGVL